MTDNDRRECQNCEHYDALDEEDMPNRGWCMAHPPVFTEMVGGEPQFEHTEVYGKSHCGEFIERQKREPEPQAEDCVQSESKPDWRCKTCAYWKTELCEVTKYNKKSHGYTGPCFGCVHWTRKP